MISTKRLWPLFVAAFVLGMSSSTPVVHADRGDCEEESPDTTGKKKNYRTVMDGQGRKVFVIEKAFVVCGKVPKPNVIYVLQASTINYEWENLKKDFLPKVVDSVKKAPF